MLGARATPPAARGISFDLAPSGVEPLDTVLKGVLLVALLKATKHLAAPASKPAVDAHHHESSMLRIRKQPTMLQTPRRLIV